MLNENKLLYLNRLQLHEELKRCLNCSTQPCMNACPVNCNPREFIRFALDEQWLDAVSTITRTNPMGQTCGLICPDKFCMKACTRSNIDYPINIPRIQATILHNYRKPRDKSREIECNGHNIAIVGAGPAGIAATETLVKRGFHVTLFEAREEIGGALCMIPPERLPHKVIEFDWEQIFDPQLVSLHLNKTIENPAELLTNFDAVIVATGEPNGIPLNIPGEVLTIPYTDYLYHPENYPCTGNVAVIGGGNVATDCALTATRAGASSVELFVRRRLSDMRISQKEYLELIQNKISINPMMSPEAVQSCGAKLSLTVRRNYFKDSKWMPLPNSTITLPYFDLIIRAIGSRADTKLDGNPNLIYAGDCKTGGSTIVEAISSGQHAAKAIIDIFT